jgi:hypothetical protein
MTAGRRSRKRHLYYLTLWVLALATAVSAPHAATTQRLVIDRHTGLALYGIDPVAYFTDKKPVEGRQDFELRFSGAVWRFDNEGNRAAFAADPDIYMPRFGGYDPIGISHGLATPGFPALWVMHEQRLYLFYTAESRAAFLAKPTDLIAAAVARWPTVKGELAE